MDPGSAPISTAPTPPLPSIEHRSSSSPQNSTRPRRRWCPTPWSLARRGFVTITVGPYNQGNSSKQPAHSKAPAINSHRLRHPNSHPELCRHVQGRHHRTLGWRVSGPEDRRDIRRQGEQGPGKGQDSWLPRWHRDHHGGRPRNSTLFTLSTSQGGCAIWTLTSSRTSIPMSAWGMPSTTRAASGTRTMTVTCAAPLRRWPS